MRQHCYLLALEVAPMQVDTVYDELPMHCTLIHRFWSELTPDQLAETVQLFFARRQPVTLVAEKRLLLGPKQVPVTELALTDELRYLHMQLYDFLHELQVEYTAPEWVGAGYRAHVSERPNARLEVGSTQQSSAVYLIEVKVPGHDHQRFVHARFELHTLQKV